MKKLCSVFAVCLLLAGCGNSGSGEQSDDKKSASTFTVGMECNYAPFNWTDVDKSEFNVKEGSGNGYCDGYDVQIAQSVAASMGKELVIKKMDWDSLEPSLSSGSIDAIIAGMTDTEERRQNADFTEPYYQSNMVMIVMKDSSYASATKLSDFEGSTVQGQMNTMYDTVIDQIKDVKHAQPLESYPYMIAALKAGTVDALTAETPVALGAVAAHPDLAMVEFDAGEGFNIDAADSAVSIAVKKGNTALKGEIQIALNKISETDRKAMMEDATKRQPAAE